MKELDANKQMEQHNKCLAILDMIRQNRRILQAALSDSKNPIYIQLHGKDYYAEKINQRRKIENRLTCYYAKEVAKLASEPYEVALEIIKPNYSIIKTKKNE